MDVGDEKQQRFESRKQTDRVHEFMKRKMAELEEEERKEREAFEKLSSLEKFEKLRKSIADLDMRLHEHIFEGRHRMDEAGEMQGHYRIVSTERILCRGRLEDDEEIHNAILLVREDGTITVRCSNRGCSDCIYGLPE